MALNVDTNFPPSGPAPYRIDPSWCIGDSLTIINNNSFNFDNRLESLDTRATVISASVDTKVSKFGDTMTGGLTINGNLNVRNVVTAGGANDSAFIFRDRNLNGTSGGIYRNSGINRLWDQAAGDVITYNSSGNVGIGTSTPSTRLHINGDCIVQGGGINIQRTSSDYNAVALTNTGGVQVQLNANGNSEGNLRTVTNHRLSFSTNNSERMVIDTSGNVGIGTIVPTSRLDVNGTVTATTFVGNLNGTASNIADNSVTTAKIANNNVTTAKIADGNITASKLSGNQTGSQPIYGARAWALVNEGAGTIVASGHISSLQDQGTGNVFVFFNTNMPDTNYAVVVTPQHSPGQGNCLSNFLTRAINYVQIISTSASFNTLGDNIFSVAIFR